MSPVKYELGSYIPEDGILHNDRCETLKSYKVKFLSVTGRDSTCSLQASRFPHFS
jgi:hypothetical protein